MLIIMLFLQIAVVLITYDVEWMKTAVMIYQFNCIASMYYVYFVTRPIFVII